MRTALIVIGIVLVAAGLLWPLLSRLGLFRLPGDFVFGGEGFRIYVPLMSSLIISIVLTLILWLFRR